MTNKTIFHSALCPRILAIGALALLVNSVTVRDSLGQENLETASESSAAATAGDEAAVSEITIHARALSRAFRRAARIATPSVVTILSYGQNVAANQGANQGETPNE